MRELIIRGVDFRLALLGENFNTKPQGFAEAQRDFGDRIVQYGYVAGREEYCSWLNRGTVVVSTAIQENFGISVMEAIAHGCHPVLPNRLSYPEIIPASFHDTCLYDDQDQMVMLLQARLGAPTSLEARASEELVLHARGFEWDHRVRQFDDLMEETAGSGHE